MRKFKESYIVLDGDAIIVIFEDSPIHLEQSKLFGYYIYATNRRGEPLSDNKYFSCIEDAKLRALFELKELGYFN
jgi:hypothetical protein